MNKRIIIAIDGYSSCGKSTFAKAIARQIKYTYIDSGAMYRAVTLYAMRAGFAKNKSVDVNGVKKILPEIHINFVYNPDKDEYETFLNSESVEDEIRGIDVSGNVSSISQIAEVRERMVELQREIGVIKGIVMDGRDIGTVVFPDAELKIFMNASVDIRAQRRYEELRAKGIDTTLEEIKQNIIARDIADENRDISPLRRAEDAVLLDNSRMTVDEQMKWVMELISERINGSRN